MSISSSLRRLRIERGMTQEQAAERLNVTRQAISSYESGRTRPDIDTLIRLCEVYGTDLDGVIYGQDRALKSIKRVKTAAIVMFVLLAALTLVSSALLWSANHFFAIPEGQLSAEEMLLFSTRMRLSRAREFVEAACLTLSLWGALTLLILILAGKCFFPLKVKLIYVAALAAALLAVSVPFGAFDPVFAMADYVITPFLAISRVLVFFIIDLIISLARRIRSKKPG